MRSSCRFATSVAFSILIVLIAAVLPAAAQTDASFGVKETSTKTYATARVTADLNGDGIPDLIEPYARITPGVLFSVQLGLGNGYFAAPVSYAASINHQQGDIVLTADLNRDGKADVIFITGNYLLVFLGRGDGTLMPAQQYTLPGVGAAFAEVGDFNHDGIPDLALEIVPATGPSTVAVAYGTGTGAFSTPATVATIASTQGVETMAVGDFDGDSNLDIAVGLSNQPCNEGGCTSDDIHILYGNGKGSFANELVYPGVPSDLIFASGDLNNDGRSDLVAELARPNGSGENLLALFGQTSRTVAAEYINTGGYYAASLPQAIADFNGDGTNDLAVQLEGLPSAPNDQALGLLLRGPNNSFMLQEIDSGAQSPPDEGALLIGDFNRDGKPDILFTAADNSDSIFNVFDHTNTTSGGVRARCEYPSGAAGMSICLYRSGANGAKVSFSAAANWFEPLRKFELWLDGRKVTEQHHVWDKYAWLSSAASTFSAGTHRADFYTAGYDNVLQHQQVTFKVPGPTCPPPSSPGVNVCSPANGSTVGGSVEALAGGAITGTVLRMEVWVDGAKRYSTFGSDLLDATLMETPGAHMLTFYILNTSGEALDKSVNITVQ